MSTLSIHPSGRYLVRDGRPFLLVADTAWSAFADASLPEWREYTARRAEQGFTHVMVSALPILHDRAVRAGQREPFALDGHGRYRFDEPQDDYFRTAGEFAAIAAENGLSLGVVVLWCNYVEGTWGAARTPGSVMPDEARVRFVDRVVEVFAPHHPLFIVSGDERFDGEASRQVYGQTLRQVKRAAPDCLTTLHSTPDTELPAVLADDDALDLYSYQAGHHEDRQDLAWRLAEQYLDQRRRRPVMDLEPCYEGHGFGGGLGRYRAAEVRRATWWSLAGGASAGIGYGAHGVWQWYREGARFTSPDFSLEPFSWRTALAFPGADDVAFAARLLCDEGLIGAEPRQELLRDAFPGLRAFGLDRGALAIYLPDPRDVVVAADLTGREVVGWDLERRSPLAIRTRPVEGGTAIRRPDVLGDILVVARSAEE